MGHMGGRAAAGQNLDLHTHTRTRTHTHTHTHTQTHTHRHTETFPCNGPWVKCLMASYWSIAQMFVSFLLALGLSVRGPSSSSAAYLLRAQDPVPDVELAEGAHKRLDGVEALPPAVLVLTQHQGPATCRSKVKPIPLLLFNFSGSSFCWNTVYYQCTNTVTIPITKCHLNTFNPIKRFLLSDAVLN